MCVLLCSIVSKKLLVVLVTLFATSNFPCPSLHNVSGRGRPTLLSRLFLAQDIAASQQLAHMIAEACVKRCAAPGGAVPQVPTGSVAHLVQQGYSQVLRALLFSNPALFVGLEPALLGAALATSCAVPPTPWEPAWDHAGSPQGPHGGTRAARGQRWQSRSDSRTPAVQSLEAGHLAVQARPQPGQMPADGGVMARAVRDELPGLPMQSVVDAVRSRTASLASSVQARVLHFQEGNVMQVRGPCV